MSLDQKSIWLPWVLLLDLGLVVIHYTTLTMIIPLNAYGGGIYIPALNQEITFMHVVLLVIAFGAIVAPAVAWTIMLGKKAGNPNFFSDEYQIMFWVSGAVYLSCVALEFAFIAKRYMEATVPIFGQVAAAPSMNMASALLMSATFLAVNFMFSMLTGLVLQKTLAET